MHSVVDDYTRLAYSEPLPDEEGTTVAAFTDRALRTFRLLGITDITDIVEIMTDNHWRYTRSRLFAVLLAQHDIRHITIKTLYPQQNGKVNDTAKPSNQNGSTPNPGRIIKPETKPSTTGSTTALEAKPPISRP